MSFLELKNEIAQPAYDGLTDQQIADKVNTDTITENKSLMSSSDVLNAIDKTQWDGLSDIDQRKIWDVLHMGDVNPFGIEAQIFIDVFGAGSATILALQAARKITLTVAKSLGFDSVSDQMVFNARTGSW